MYRFAGPDWKPNPWQNLPALQLASVIYALVLGLLGCVVFSKPNIALTIAVNIFLYIRRLFILFEKELKII